MSTSKPKWHEGPLAGFDLETTGVDVYGDRIVTAAVVHHTPGSRPRALQWVINPGTDVPAEAAEVHGWTNQRLNDYLGDREAARRLLSRAITASPSRFEAAERNLARASAE